MNWQAAWTIAQQRDGGQCWGCGSTHQVSKQHRQNRQMGGDPTKSKERPSNLMSLTLATNDDLEGRLREMGLLLGWKVLNNSPLDTTEVPAWSAMWATWIKLDDEGLAQWISHDEAVERIQESTNIADVAARIDELGLLSWRCGMPAPRVGR